MRLFRLIVLGGLAAAVVRCGGDGGNGPPTITSVVVNGDSTVVLAGTRQLTATAMAGSTPVSTGVTFQWFSSDTTRATVSSSGLVSGVRLGSAGISALAVLNGTPTAVSSSAHAVRTRIGSIAVTPGDRTFSSLGDGATLTAEARTALNAAVPGVTFTWVSRAPSIVSAQGRVGDSQQADVSALQNGSARIVVTGDGVSDSVTATVHQVATTLGLTPIVFMFDRINASDTISAVVLDARGHQLDDSMIVWASRNTAVATVNATGVSGARVIRAVNEGQTRVAATSGVFGDSVDVSVNLVYTSVQITTSGALPTPLDTARINRLNGSLQLGLIVRDAGNTIVPNPQDFAWSLENPGAIAAIGLTTGLVTGNSNTGTDTIVVVARGNRDTVPLVVRQVPASVSLLPANFGGTPNVQMTVSQSAPFYAVVRDSSDNVDPSARTDVTWSVTPGTSASLSAGTSATVTVTTNATPGSETVRATIGSLSGQRIVAVAGTGVSFSANVQPVFTTSCVGCHTGAGAPAGMSLAAGVAYGAIVDQASGQVPTLERVRPFRPDSSYLAHKIQGTQATVGGSGARMPLGCNGGTCLSETTINLIRNWILQGAVNN